MEFTKDYTGEQFPYTKRRASSKIIRYIQIVEQTDEEKLKMYMKCTKEELAKMLIAANKAIPPLRYSHNEAVKLANKLNYKVNYKL